MDPNTGSSIAVPDRPAGLGTTADVWQWPQPLVVQTAEEFLREASGLVGAGQRGPLRICLRQASNMDACGLQVLMALAVEALKAGRLFEITEASPRVARQLQLAGVGYLMREA